MRAASSRTGVIRARSDRQTTAAVGTPARRQQHHAPPLLRRGYHRISSITQAAPADQPQLSLALQGARAALLALLDAPGGSGGNRGEDAAVAAAVDSLIKENPSLTPGLDTPTVGVGVWEVFYAPHIARLSSLFATRFDPIRYTLFPGGAFISNVRYSSPLLGTGWLSAAGSLSAVDESSVRVDFRDFWVDLGEDLRPGAPKGGGNGGSAASGGWADSAVEALGRAFFLPQLSVFPVLYLDGDLSVFQFPPLSSNIAVRRVTVGGDSGGGSEGAAQ